VLSCNSFIYSELMEGRGGLVPRERLGKKTFGAIRKMFAVKVESDRHALISICIRAVPRPPRLDGET
jgi:hypothetical protein